MFDFDSAELHKGEAPGGSGLAGMVIVIIGWAALAVIGYWLWF